MADDGTIFFVDPLIRLKKPAKEVIEYLVGDIWQDIKDD